MLNDMIADCDSLAPKPIVFPHAKPSNGIAVMYSNDSRRHIL